MVKPLTEPRAFHINQMLQSIPHDPTVAGGIMTDPEAVYDRFGLSEAERAPFRSGDAAAIRALGIHPHLLMPWTLLTNERVRGFLAIDPAHFARLPGKGN
ncbi:hypothetical protein [Sphingobium estronivorans]|uniref:hypothetical protein n=1 Tax=Sphingobium estronivorans TaxID=1577690 RepID=UPI00123BF6EA|nr:hypothetical protein [Sphingobium estronivorans]